MRFKQVMIALGKAACYTLLFIGTQLFVSYAAAVFMGIRSGLQILSGDSAPEAGALAEQMADTLLGNAMLLTLISNALTLLILLPVFAAQKKSYVREISLFPLVPGAIWPLVSGAMALAAVVALVLALLPIPQELMDAYNSAAVGLGEPGLISALSTVLFAPIAEEVIFRGLVYTRLRRAMPAALACVLSSLVFGLLHGQLLWIAYAFIMGVVLTLVFERTGTLWASIVVHVTFNLVGTYAVQYLPGSFFILVLGLAGAAASWNWISHLYPRA